MELQATEGSLAAYVWAFEPPGGASPTPRPRVAVGPGVERGLHRVVKDLKRRGWRFVGPTTVYAFMQAMGLVNDHLEGCWVREEVESARGRPAPAHGGLTWPTAA